MEAPPTKTEISPEAEPPSPEPTRARLLPALAAEAAGLVLGLLLTLGILSLGWLFGLPGPGRVELGQRTDFDPSVASPPADAVQLGAVIEETGRHHAEKTIEST